MYRFCLAIAFLFCVSFFFGGAADEGHNVSLLLGYCPSILCLHSKGVLQIKAVMYRFCLAIAFLFCVSILRGCCRWRPSCTAIAQLLPFYFVSPFYGAAADEGRNVSLLFGYCFSILCLHSKGLLQMKAVIYRFYLAIAFLFCVSIPWGCCR